MAPPSIPRAHFQRLPLGVEDCLGSGRGPSKHIPEPDAFSGPIRLTTFQLLQVLD